VYWFGMARRLGVPTAPGTRGVPTIHADASRTDIVACRSCRWPCARRAAAPYTARPNDPTATKEFGKTTPKPAWRQPIPSPSHRIMNASERSLRQATFTPLLGRHHQQPSLRHILTRTNLGRVLAIPMGMRAGHQDGVRGDEKG
jgi:hypothetical protein